MLDKFRETAITWDKATRRIYSPITANASDSNGRKLNIQVVNSGQVENLTGATLHLYWETKDKAQYGLDVFKASDISKGEFEIFYTTGMLSNVGELNATLVLVDATGKVVSDWFKITVARGIDGDAIQSENSFTTLTQALIDISDLEQNYTPRLNDLTAQLQQTERELNDQLALTEANKASKEELEIGLNSKVSKGENESISWAMADQEFKEYALGDKPMPIVGPGSVNTVNMVDNAATFAKRTVLGLLPLIIIGSSGILPDYDSKLRILKMNSGVFILIGKTRYQIPANTQVDCSAALAGATNCAVIYDTNTGLLRAIAGNLASSIAESEVVIATISIKNVATDELIDISINSKVTINGIDKEIYLQKSQWETKHIKNEAITSRKRTPLGNLPFIYFGFTTGKHPNFNSYTKQIEVPEVVFLVQGTSQYQANTNGFISVERGLTNSTSAFVYFDTVSKTFKDYPAAYISSGNEVAKETEILVCVIYSMNGQYDMAINSQYKIDGYYPFEKRPGSSVNLNSATLLDFPAKVYPAIGDAESPFNFSTDTHQTVYALYDSLMAEFPNYITRKIIKITSNSIPIYEYFFNPDRPRRVGSPNPLPYPKILLGALIHGGENMAVYALYYLMEQICRNWQDHKTLEYLRFNIQFKVIPIKSPNDFNNKTYVNANGVNNNANFDWLWEESTSPNKGSEPFSEIETQAQRDWLAENSDAILHFDLHERAELVPDEEMMWMGRDPSDFSQFLFTTLEEMTRRWKQRHPQLPDIFYGFLTQGVGNGTTRGYSSNVAGIRTYLWEGFSQSQTMSANKGSDVVSMNVEYLGTFIVNAIKELRANN